MFLVEISLFVVTCPSHISLILTLKQSTKELKPQVRTHQVDIIVIIIIDAMLVLCCSTMSHATLTLSYHTFMLTLHHSLKPRALWLPQM